ncbi:MAG: glycosyltransferase family 4 protein [Actinobacteria bacterium]|nr:glycosyltransferase family 4 protein [Actinomycetota bacterium]
MKKLLVIANPYPPMASAGTTRVVRFIRHLPDEGWQPSVLTAKAEGPAAVPPGVRVARAAVPWPKRLLGGGRRSTRINRWVAVPDPYFAWIGPAVLKGREIFRRERFDAILSSSPRASVHLAAAVLSEHADVPWLADYRDPWSTYQFRQYPTQAHRAAHERLEAWALRRAAAVTAVNRPIADDLVARHPWLAGRTHVLPNGFDRAEQPADVRLGDGFWIVHTGRLYGREQQVAAFLEALAAQPPEVKAFFVGVDESRVRPDADRLGLGDRVRVEPLVPLPLALGYQRAADALLLVNGRRPESMSSKVFEYLQAGRPIFAISPAGSAARALFEEVGGGTCVLPDDPMGGPLADFVAAARAGTAPVADPAALGRYELAQLTRELAAILDELAAHPWTADPDDRAPSQEPRR